VASPRATELCAAGVRREAPHERSCYGQIEQFPHVIRPTAPASSRTITLRAESVRWHGPSVSSLASSDRFPACPCVAYRAAQQSECQNRGSKPSLCEYSGQFNEDRAFPVAGQAANPVSGPCWYNISTLCADHRTEIETPVSYGW